MKTDWPKVKLAYVNGNKTLREIAEEFGIKAAGVMTRATFLDFIYNKGPGALAGSTMRRLANAGDLAGACHQNERWNKGTVDGVLRVLPGLQTRAEANAEICATWRIEEGLP